MASYEQSTDEAIIEKVQGGEVEPFGFLVKRYENKILRYGRKFLSKNEDIEDIVQTVFLKAYENIKSFDLNKRFSPWIYRIAHNEFVNGLKKKGKEPLPLLDIDNFLPHSTRADEAIEKEETKKIINGCLDKIKPKYREILTLYYFENLSYGEISEVLHLPQGTVAVRIKRAKEQAKTWLSHLDTIV